MASAGKLGVPFADAFVMDYVLKRMPVEHMIHSHGEMEEGKNVCVDGTILLMRDLISALEDCAHMKNERDALAAVTAARYLMNSVYPKGSDKRHDEFKECYQVAFAEMAKLSYR